MEILILQLVSTWAMVGIIWFVQVVHYPLFALAGAEGFSEYHKFHTNRTTWIVGPPMLVELGCAIWLVARRPMGVGSSEAMTGLVLVVVLWLSTALLQVPLHERLARGRDEILQRRLVQGNWLRTVVWTGRGFLALRMLWVMAVR